MGKPVKHCIVCGGAYQSFSKLQTCGWNCYQSWVQDYWNKRTA